MTRTCIYCVLLGVGLSIASWFAVGPTLQWMTTQVAASTTLPVEPPTSRMAGIDR